MTTSPTPTPASSGFLPDVLDDHADTAGFLRALRERVVRSRTAGLDDLRRLDERLDAHIDALVLAGCDEAAPIARAATRSGFVPAVIALRSRRADVLDEEIRRAGDGAAPRREIVSALGWAPASDGLATLRSVHVEGDASSLSRALRAALVDAMRVHGIARLDGGDPVAEGVGDADPRVRSSALRAAGELGRRDLAPRVADALSDPDPGCRAHAAWSGALFGDAGATRALMDVASRTGSARALELAVRTAGQAEAEALIHAAFGAGRRREAIGAAATWGSARGAPWLLAKMEDPALARLAGWAFTTITGVDLVRGSLTAPAPPGFAASPSDDPIEHEVRMDPDARLPWPDARRLAALWADLGPRLPEGAPLLGGRPRDEVTLAEALRGGSQRAREIAAVDLHLAARGARPLFNVRAPAFRQLRLLPPPSAVDHVAAR